jgi:hypothetical protein
MGARDDASDDDKKLILAKESSPENIKALKKMIN